MLESLLEEAARVSEELSFGDSGSSESIIARLSAAGSDAALAWGLLLLAQRRQLGEAEVSKPNASFAALVHASEAVREIACRTLWYEERAALLRFDVSGLRAHLEVHETMSRGLSTPAITLPVKLAHCWLDWLEGRSSVDAAVELGRAARQAQIAAHVIEAQVLTSLHHLSQGALDHATATARRASRMARAEAIPDAEALASLALARVRRRQDRPHLAVRILAGLAPHAPPIWREWMAWEAVLSGALSIRRLDPSSLAGRVVALADAARDGRPDLTQGPADALLARTANIHPLHADAQDAIAILCPNRSARGPIAAWRSGKTAELPAGITGVAFAGPVETTNDTTCARVVLLSSGKAQRVAALTSPAAVALYEADAGPAEGPTRPRTDSGLSALALAGGDMAVPDYFRQVYGYAFDPAVHNAVLTMHTHRMRERLGDSATLTREDASFQLAPRHALLLRDPRCEEPLSHRVLRSIATAGRRSATELAQEMDVPLRTMQRMLKDLHVGEDVVVVKSGRSVAYEIEDTTFSEPTRSRRFGDALIEE